MVADSPLERWMNTLVAAHPSQTRTWITVMSWPTDHAARICRRAWR